MIRVNQILTTFIGKAINYRIGILAGMNVILVILHLWNITIAWTDFNAGMYILFGLYAGSIFIFIFEKKW